MIPVLALVGRPNVGKSTLFNCLTKTRNALVADFPGLTRDRLYGHGQLSEQPHIVIDTGGLSDEEDHIYTAMEKQTQQAIAEADAILFLVDAQSGLTAADEMIAAELRKTSKPIFLVVNKIDGHNEDVVSADFYRLGFSEVFNIAAAHSRGVKQLIEHVLDFFPSAETENIDDEEVTTEEVDRSIRVAIVGRPNVGKSTLVNRMLGEERVVVFDAPGTTRDSIYIPFERHGQAYTLIDTAGLRRRGRVHETVEKFSVVKTLQAVEEAHVAIVLIDAREGITDQDLHILGFVLEAGKGLIIVVNKWDGLTSEHKTQVRDNLHRRLNFAEFAAWHYISAMHGTGVGELYDTIKRTYMSAMKKLSTAELTDLLQRAQQAFEPPLVKGRRIKLRYAHAGGHNPPIIVIHGNQTESLPESYQRYLINFYRQALKLVGTPIRLQLKSGDNPFKDKKNVLTDRQRRKKKRLLQFAKKKH